MPSLRHRLLELVRGAGYRPLPAKALARRLDLAPPEVAGFRRLLKDLTAEGAIFLGKGRTILAEPAGRGGGDAGIVGLFRKLPSGVGIVRPRPGEKFAGKEIFIPADNVGDAATGDEVLVRIDRTSVKRARGPKGVVVRVLERLTRQFVGAYFEKGEESFVRVDGTTFHEPIYVGDPGARGAKSGDQVVFEMVRFPSPVARGEGVITEVLGPRGEPGVDLLAIVRAYDLPDLFPPAVLEEARRQAAAFSEDDLTGRIDFRDQLCVTIDPPDAHDFDDAIGLTFDSQRRRWHLAVHIADVCHFVPAGSLLDREAKNRGTSVYLPGRVLPMFPEILSNGLASLQAGKTRFVQSVLMEFDDTGEPLHAEFHRSAIKVRRRLSYEEAGELLKAKPDRAGSRQHEVHELLHRLHAFTQLLRGRRLRRGAFELDMPEVELEYDEEGRVVGGHLAQRDAAHQLVEECMLAANEAVAEFLHRKRIAFLRRNHDAPDALKLEAFLGFAKALGHEVDLRRPTDRFQLQRILAEAARQPHHRAVHYALLRSLKQANYSPEEQGHYALASRHYCHFTSPIRRYPDVTVHRLLAQVQRTGKAGSDAEELAALGEHCSFTERRADRAEQELVKAKLLAYLSTRLGMELDIVITSVEEFGFFGQGELLPVEGLVHLRTLVDDDYWFDEAHYSLVGRRSKRRFRLGDRVRVKVAQVDQAKRQLDFRLVAGPAARGSQAIAIPKRTRGKK